MVLWEVFLNRSPWNHGKHPQKEIRPRNCSEDRSARAQGTSGRAAISFYVAIPA